MAFFAGMGNRFIFLRERFLSRISAKKNRVFFPFLFLFLLFFGGVFVLFGVFFFVFLIWFFFRRWHEQNREFPL